MSEELNTMRELMERLMEEGKISEGEYLASMNTLKHAWERTPKSYTPIAGGGGGVADDAGAPPPTHNIQLFFQTPILCIKPVCPSENPERVFVARYVFDDTSMDTRNAFSDFLTKLIHYANEPSEERKRQTNEAYIHLDIHNSTVTKFLRFLCNPREARVLYRDEMRRISDRWRTFEYREAFLSLPAVRMKTLYEHFNFMAPIVKTYNELLTLGFNESREGKKLKEVWNLERGMARILDRLKIDSVFTSEFFQLRKKDEFRHLDKAKLHKVRLEFDTHSTHTKSWNQFNLYTDKVKLGSIGNTPKYGLLLLQIALLLDGLNDAPENHARFRGAMFEAKLDSYESYEALGSRGRGNQSFQLDVSGITARTKSQHRTYHIPDLCRVIYVDGLAIGK